MKIILVTGSTSAMSLAGWLLQQNMLAGVALQDILDNHNPGLLQWLRQNGVSSTVVNKEGVDMSFKDWVYNIRPDIVLVFGFSFILPGKIFGGSVFGFYNIHFSLLPAYKGPSPLFWQLRNGEKMSGVTIHRMTDKADSGDIMVQLSYMISEEDTLGILHAKLSEMVLPAVQQFLQLQLFEKSQVPVSHAYETKSSYQKRPEQKDILIDWQNMTASAIRCLVQAANPVYQGACTFFKGVETRLLQVTVISRAANHNVHQPGEVIADAEDLEIMCACGSSIVVEVAATTLGVMTGKKWKQLFTGSVLQENKICFS